MGSEKGPRPTAVLAATCSTYNALGSRGESVCSVMLESGSVMLVLDDCCR